MKRCLFLINLVLICSCNSENKLKQDLAQLQSRKISISLDKMQHQINGRDTFMTDFTDSQLKLVVYSDSSACSSCIINKMYLWDSFIKYAEKYKCRLKFYFIFSPKQADLEIVMRDLKANSFDYPIFIDSEGIFAKETPHLPKNSQLHTFLLDKNNKIILVGNPLNNKKIESLFYEIAERELRKK